MAAETFRIEIPIRVDDQTDPGVSQATRKVNGFDKANQKTQERLNQMNRTRYQVVLNALDKASSIIGSVSTRARSIAGKTFSFTMKVVDMATAPLRAVWNFATSIQGAILGATGAFAGIYKPMEIAGDFEQTQIAFETMLKSAEKADKFLKEASAFANKTPFEFPELINSSKLLLAFGFEADKILDLMTVIGDTSSGLGAGAEGIDRITRALGQMKAKGRAQAEELLQLQELGVPANQILQEELGLTGQQIANIGNESIEASKVIDALLRGMDKRFGGMMQNQSKTAKGMISTLSDTLKNGLLRPWGQGLWEGIKPGLSKITTWLDENSETVMAWGEAWKEAGANISKWVMSKVEALQTSIRKMTNSQEWKDAKSFGSKMKIAWNTIIAEPFMEWWNSTGKAWLADKASKIGEGIGGAISAGLLALLGVNVSGAVEDGTSIGAAFATGFQKGFDGKKVGEAILNAIKGVFKDAGTLLPGGEEASSTSWLSAGAIGLVLAKLGVFKLLGKGGKGLLNMFGKGSKSALPGATGSALGGEAWSTSVMYVSASVVYLSGPTFGGGGGKAPGGGMIPGLPGGGGGLPKLPGGGAPLALPGAAGAAGKAYSVFAPTGTAGTSVLMGTTGSAITAGLANTGYALGSGATTIGGAAAVGGASITGIIGGLLGLGSAAIDVFQGSKASKAGDKKGAKDEYVTAGTKAGMVGTGAAIGAGVGAIFGGVGAVPGALIGAGVGGIAALFTGDKAGKALSDASDSGGWLSNAGSAIGDFFTDTLPEGWNNFWGGVGNFFSEQVPYGIGYAAGKTQIFFTSTLPTFFSNLWSGVSTFFISTLPTWASNTWNNNIVPFFTQSIPNFFSNLWTGITTFFTSTLPTWASNTWNNSIVPFFTQSIPNFFTNLWSGVTAFVTQTIPTAAANVGASIKGFFTDSIPNFFKGLWDKISGGFSEGYTAATGSTQKHAYGGIMTSPHMGIVAEDGAEGIIPLSPSKRRRGIDLWQRTGDLLGIRAYEDGGIVGDTPEAVPTSTSAGRGNGNITIKVEVKAEPSFTVEGGDSVDDNRIIALLKSYIREMADDIGDELAERLARIFANMPVKGGAGT